MFLQNCIGIDIQQHALVLLYLRKNFRTITVGGHAVYSLAQDPYLKGKPGIAGEYIHEFIKTHRIVSPDIYMSIPRELVFVREIEFPSAVRENLRASLTYELEKYIPFSPEEAYFDCQVVAEDKQGDRITVLLVAAKKKDLAPYIELVNQLEPGISGLEISATALVNQVVGGAGGKSMAAESCLLAYPGESSVEINCIRKGLLQYSRVLRLPGSGEDSVAFLTREFNPIREYLKTEAKPVMAYHCGVTGPLADFLKQDADLIFSELDMTGGRSLPPLFIPALGLARRGLEKTPMQINLLPLFLRKKPSKTQYYVLYALSVLLLLSLLLWGGGKAMQQRLALNRLEEEMSRLQTEVKSIDRIQEDSRQIEARLNLVNRLYQEYPSTMEILRELSQRIPDSAWIHDFSLNKKDLQIIGTASSAAELIPVLEDSALFQDVVFLAPITRDKEGREEFRIGLKLK